MLSSSPRVAIVGGGISGLAAAWRLQQHGAFPTLFEASDRTGGVIRSVRRDGFLVDEGPNTLVARSPVLPDAVDALGLATEQVRASEAAASRYVVRDGALVPVPTSPPGLVTTPLLSARAKLRLLREPFVRASDDPDEPLADFVRRRLGSEVLDYAVDPFVAGVYAGAPERLSTRHAFPLLHEFERAHGSLVRGLFHRARSASGARPDRRPFSFRGGVQTLPGAFAEALGDAVRLQSPVKSLRWDDEGWQIAADGATDERFDGVVLALPLHRLAELGLETDVDRAAFAEVTYPPVSLLALGFRRDAVAHPLDGFGALVPRREQRNLLGVLFSSTLFPDRAPADHVLLTCFIGGARQPDLARRPADDLVRLALGDLRSLLGVQGDPVFVHHAHWPRAIPQYEVGYDRVLGTMERLEAVHPGLRIAGNGRRGISVGEALEAGFDAADALLDAARP